MGCPVDLESDVFDAIPSMLGGSPILNLCLSEVAAVTRNIDAAASIIVKIIPTPVIE